MISQAKPAGAGGGSHRTGTEGVEKGERDNGWGVGNAGDCATDASGCAGEGTLPSCSSQKVRADHDSGCGRWLGASRDEMDQGNDSCFKDDTGCFKDDRCVTRDDGGCELDDDTWSGGRRSRGRASACADLAVGESAADQLWAAVEELLECPVCCMELSAPIYQCHRGHVICSACISHLAHHSSSDCHAGVEAAADWVAGTATGLVTGAAAAAPLAAASLGGAVSLLHATNSPLLAPGRVTIRGITPHSNLFGSRVGVDGAWRDGHSNNRVGGTVVGILFAIFQWFMVSRIRVGGAPDGQYGLLEDGTADTVLQQVSEIQSAISMGAESFLTTEYKYLAVFMSGFSVIIFLFLGSVDNFDKQGIANAGFSTLAFILGALTSTGSGYLGMKIATYANARTTLEARKGIPAAFVAAFRAGSVMGFLLSANGLLVLFLTILAYRKYYGDDWAGLYESITGYGLGGSSVALFGRVGGGIYTKAADVGADLVGKVERNIPEDDPRNPAVIADNVGDNVGDIAGMGSDLFGSFAESTCAALVISALSQPGKDHDFSAMCFPLLVSGAGILVCLITTIIATDIQQVKEKAEIEPALKKQLVISTVLMTPVIFLVAFYALPPTFKITVVGQGDKVVQNWYASACVSSGLWAGLLIGFVTEYFTSNAYVPVQDVADSCRTGAATNIIFGLALGYKSVIIPVFAIAAAIYVSFQFAGMYGIALAALGMLSTLATGLAIDAYGPISDNAGGIAEMAGMGEEIRERTDALDAAGNTTAAIGKGFAIGSAALVSLALFGAYVSRAKVNVVNVTEPQAFVGLLVGAMLPYWFSAMTMKSVGKAALAMVEEVRRQFNTMPGLMEGTTKPDYKKCVEISTAASLREMIPPGALVMLSPVIAGTLFGTTTLAGMLAGALVSGVQIAISASNTGGAWDNAKKYIEAGNSAHAKSLGPKGSDPHKAAVIGDTVGDPLKDTSGPSLNILIKLMAVESLVFAPFFATHGGIIWGGK
ncbi:unnamed protein product [Closterium sp. NIES-65]|nr:unnamed protein product [Closterium sp. NIES-65]